MRKPSKFADMADGVEASLDHMRMCEKVVKDAEEELARAHADLKEARAEFIDARDAFHAEFPEMAPAQVTVADVQAGPAVGEGTQPVEEARPVPVMTPQGPVVFREMEDNPFGVGD